MFEFVVNVVVWVFCIYGFFAAIQDYIKMKIYKKVEENIKIIMTVKNVENGIEEYIRDLTFGRNFYHNLVVIDQDSDDDTMNILHKLEKEKFNMRVLSKEQGKKYFDELQ